MCFKKVVIKNKSKDSLCNVCHLLVRDRKCPKSNYSINKANVRKENWERKHMQIFKII